jgi:phosphoglycerate dehydrogenase-like enzyme
LTCVVSTAPDEDLEQAVGTAEIVITSHWTRRMAAHAPHVRFIQLPGAGWDGIERTAVGPGVLVANCYEHEWAIAEYVLMVCLALRRELLRADQALRRVRWDYHFAAGHPLFSELRGLTLGVVGLGRIGRAAARLAAAFQMNVNAVDVQLPTPEEARAIPVTSVRHVRHLTDLIANADFALLSLPLTPETRGMIGYEELRCFKRGASLINVARAEIVDEAALFRALRSSELHGAALGTWWTYPIGTRMAAPSRYPFHTLDNVIMTPHYSGSTHQTVERRMAVIAENVNRFLTGLPVEHVVEEFSRAGVGAEAASS